MPFKKGQSGNPGGRPKTKEFTEAIRLAVHEAQGNRTRLRVIADALVDKAIEGDLSAIREVADRLDGKPAIAAQVDMTPPKTRVEEMSDEELIAVISQTSQDFLDTFENSYLKPSDEQLEPIKELAEMGKSDGDKSAR
jgi:hypothetical protein